MVIGPVDVYGDGSCDWSLGDDFDGAEMTLMELWRCPMTVL